MDTNDPRLRLSVWALGLAFLFAVSALALFVGKVFCEWPIDAVAVVLFLVIWIPAVLPSLHRFKFKDFEVEFIERTMKQVQADVATLADKIEIESEKRKLNITVDPYKIRCHCLPGPRNLYELVVGC